jgi:hypothetical protein
MDDRGSVSGRSREFIRFRVQTGSEAHATSYPMGAVGSVLGGKAAGA